MYVGMCVYVGMYVCMYVCMYVGMYVCVRMYVRPSLYGCNTTTVASHIHFGN